MKISNLTKDRIREFLAEGKRFDGRKPLDFRKIEIETGVSKFAEGSVRVKIGDTEVVAGVKLDVTEPYPDSEDEGTLITTVELLPLSSPKYEPGPPRIEAIELARIVDRGIRESGLIDFSKLCIEKGEKVYGVFVDIYSINDAGNLIDASCLAAVSALQIARMPKYDAKKEKVKHGEFTSETLPLTKAAPITVTFYKIGNKILVDPTEEEDEASDGRVSIALSKKTGKKEDILINAVQKGKTGTFKEEELFKIIDLAVEKAEELEEAIKIK
ncbi:MAG: exosome complex protein Rrp42 [Nanoarchaeota archaeon]